MLKLNEVRGACKKLTRDDFIATVEVPLLLHREEELDAEEARGFKTGIINPAMLSSAAQSIGDELVFELRKRDGGAFPDRISVGRTRGAVDVQLAYPEISKYHAYFTRQGSQHFITDAKATNGTFVNDTRLTPHVATALPPLAVLRFGIHVFRFFTPGELYDYLLTSL